MVRSEVPRHKVHLERYWIARVPVTNAQYRSSWRMRSTRAKPLGQWPRAARIGKPPGGQRDLA